MSEQSLKILWHSNTAWSGTGYGNQTETFVPRLQKLGHDVILSAFWGLNGAVLNLGNIKVLPGSKNPYGNDMILAHHQYYKTDIVIGLHDIQVMEHEVLRLVENYHSWVPIDSDPCPPSVEKALRLCKGVVSMSQYGHKKLADIGIYSTYIPHGVDSDIYKPIDRTEARKAISAPQDAFMVGMILANKGAPSRKAFDQQIRAFAKFAKFHPEAILYLHTDMHGSGGENLDRIIKLAGINPKQIAIAPQYEYLNGMLTSAHMAHVYSACDVVLNATMGEGFGIPIVEAQMCGTPVIVTNFSAMTELCMTGWCVGYVDKFFNGWEAYWVIPSVDDIADKLEEAYKMRGDQDFRRQARERALAYDADLVASKYWQPYLEKVARNLNSDRNASPDVNADDYHETGIIIGEWVHLPAKDKNSDKALAVHRGSGRRKIVDGWGNDVDGIHLDLEDDPSGGVTKIVCKEIKNSYHLPEIDFKPGDVVLDIGAQVGTVSIYLAKKYPFLKVYAFEPMPATYQRLVRNIEANGVTSIVIPTNKAVTGDGRNATIYGNLQENAGGSNIYGAGGKDVAFNIQSITLEQIFAEHGIDRVKLLKLDCEGAEYELILANPAMLDKVDIIRGELHINNLFQRFNPTAFVSMVKSHVPDTDFAELRIPDVDLMPDISVIIPTYNGEKTIERAIQSALVSGGEGVKVEVVVFDDGSTDSTSAILKRYERHPMVQVWRSTENRGQVTAMNDATRHAKGRYFIFHGDDDYLEPNGLTALVLEFDRQPESVGFVYGNMQYQGERIDLVIPPAFDKDTYFRFYACLSGVAFRKSVYDAGIVWRELHKIEGLHTAHVEDWDYVLQLIQAGYVGLKVEGQTVLNYTLSFSRGWSKMKKHEKEILQLFKERHPYVMTEAL